MRLAAVALAVAVAFSSCGVPPESARSPSSPSCEAGACQIPDASDDRADGSTAAQETGFGALLVVLQTADGVEHAILCGGDVSTDIGKPRAGSCPYDHARDGGRELLKLDRGNP